MSGVPSEGIGVHGRTSCCMRGSRALHHVQASRPPGPTAVRAVRGEAQGDESHELREAKPAWRRAAVMRAIQVAPEDA